MGDVDKHRARVLLQRMTEPFGCAQARSLHANYVSAVADCQAMLLGKRVRSPPFSYRCTTSSL